MKPFVHLHLHTEFSLLDGAARIGHVFKVAKEKNMPALAITDHGNLFGLYKFYEEALKEGIKPIIGCEFYCCEDMRSRSGKQDFDHLILLAKNEKGYRNLLRLNSIAYTEGFYYKPRIQYDLLETYGEGLICLSGCIAGKLQDLLLNDRYEDAKAFAMYLKKQFAEGDFYMELQNQGLSEQLKILPLQKKLAGELGIKCVATNDVHYINKEDAKMQDVMMCVQMGKTFDEDRLKLPGQEFYLKSYDEMEVALEGYENALDVTLEIADKCEVYIKSKTHKAFTKDERYLLGAGENLIPSYVNNKGIDNFEFLKNLCYEGLKRRYKTVPEEFYKRADYELELINRLGFVEYFLIVWDYISYAESIGIPVGVGRGSGAGSIVSYSIGITKIDPMRYKLLFERFINSERVSMPDFDIDFCVDRRNEVIEYVKQKYGEDHVALIVTFGTMAAKNAIRDVARVMRYPLGEVDKITKLIPNKLPDGIKKPPVLKYYFGTTNKPENEKFIIDDLKKLYEDNETIKEIIDMAIKLEGMPRNTSTHAAGVLICPDPVYEHVALTRITGDVTTQCNMIELEHLGLLKMDFLGLRTLTDIKKAMDYIRQNHGVEINFDEMEFDDPKVFELIGNGDLDAVFQLEGAGMKKFMKALKPTCLEDIIAGVALYRPGPMDSIPKYIENKHFPHKTKYEHPVLEPILNVTYGCIVYQEQVMQIVQDMAGYSLAQADNVRRIMGKKIPEEMAKEKDFFVYGKKDKDGKVVIPGAVSKGIDSAVAEKVFQEMESFAHYAFNKSHAACYAYIAYQTAYIKTYYHAEFLTAVLNNRITNIDEIKKYVSVATQHDIKILPPDINLSEMYFSCDGKSIRFGLAALKNVGLGVVEDIILERKTNGSYKDILDFVTRVSTQSTNKRCLESLILSGAFDCFGKHRSQLMGVYANAVAMANDIKKSKASGQINMFETLNSGHNIAVSIDYPKVNEFNSNVKLDYEKEVVGVYLSGHPLDAYKDKFKSFTLTADMLKPDEPDEQAEDDQSLVYSNIKANENVVCGGMLDEIKTLITKSGKKMAFVTLEDIVGNIELVFFANAYEKYKDKLVKGAFMTVYGRVSLRDNQPPSINVDRLELWENLLDKEVQEQLPDIDKPKQKLCLRYDTSNKSLHEGVKIVLQAYQGSDEVFIKNPLTGEIFKLNILVDIRESLLFELSSILPKEDIIVV